MKTYLLLLGLLLLTLIIACGKATVLTSLSSPTVYKLPVDERAKCPRPDEVMDSAIITYHASGEVKHLEVTCKVQVLECE